MEIPREDVWTKGHLRKDGKPINEAVSETLVSITIPFIASYSFSQLYTLTWPWFLLFT